MSSRSATACCGFLLALLVATPARAGESARVSVLVILAGENSTEVHPKLDGIAREVKKRYPQLTGYRLDHIICKSVPIGKQEQFNLVAGQAASVTIERRSDKDDRTQLKIRPPHMGEIVYDTCCGKFLPIVTPFRTRDKDLLIIAVRVQACPRK